MNAGRIKTKAFKRTKSIQETITDQILFEKNAQKKKKITKQGYKTRSGRISVQVIKISKEQNRNKQQQPKYIAKNQKKQSNNKLKPIQSKQNSTKDSKLLNQYINTEKLRIEERELDQYYNFKETYLGKEGAFHEFKILIGFFHQSNFWGFDKNALEELTRRGFNYTVVRTDMEFIQKLNDFDIAWIIDIDGFNASHTQQLLKSLDLFFKNKKSLYLWADNDPLYYRSNIILKHYFNGMHLTGNYLGEKTIEAAEKVVRGTFDKNHPISYGVNNLYEGTSICHPEQIHEDFKIYAINSNNQPLVVYSESNSKHGRIIIDCGFTKHWTPYWSYAGQHQYVSNANVWLTGLPI